MPDLGTEAIIFAFIHRIEAAAHAANLPLGGVAMAEPPARALFSHGYRVICGFDLLWLKAKTAETQSWLS